MRTGAPVKRKLQCASCLTRIMRGPVRLTRKMRGAWYLSRKMRAATRAARRPTRAAARAVRRPARAAPVPHCYNRENVVDAGANGVYS